MFSVFSESRGLLAGFYLVAAAAGALLPEHARADSGVVSASGAGRDTSEAIANLLKVTVSKYFKNLPAAYLRAVLVSEILPNASSFVQSYKVAEGARPGLTALNASVDLDVINGLLSLTPKNLGAPEGAKALVLVRGAKVPDSVTAGLKPGSRPADPYAGLAAAARERFARRQFAEAEAGADDLNALGPGEEVSSPELLRSLGAKAGARVAMALTSRYEAFENENAHNKEERIVLSALVLDVSNGAVLGRASVHVVNPRSRREQYLADLQRSLLDDSKDLFHDVFVAAGRRLAKAEGPMKFSLVRVKYPPSAALLARFRALLESVPGVKSVVEYEIRRGSFDFAVRPAMEGPAFAKAVTALQAPELGVALDEAAGEDPGAARPAVAVKLVPKESVPAEGTAKVPNEF